MRAPLLAALGLLGGAPTLAAVFFDDFSYRDSAELRDAGGWLLRDRAGHPGPAGARWSPAGVQVVDDPARPNNRLLRLHARTDGSTEGTEQAQACHARKYLRGTYAARVRFSDSPTHGADGDPVIQTFYAIGPLRHDLDPEFSEVDFEYLPNGGWGSERTRLYGISWQTVQIDPWRAFNQARESFGSHAGWHVLTIQVEAARTRHYIDGRLLAEHGGRNVPVLPMSIAFSLWFSPAGLLPAGDSPRAYEMDVDWVFHAQGATLSPRDVLGRIARLRRAGTARRDELRDVEGEPAAACDL